MFIAAVLIIALVAYFLLKGYQTQATLFMAGFALLALSHFYFAATGSAVDPVKESPTGWFGFDLFAWMADGFSSRVGSIGMIIMAAGGFARYMSSIGASEALVRAAIRPLAGLKSPYALLALSYGVGQTLNIFVPSAAGLAMLLLVAMYPTLIRLGVKPVAAAATIGTTACLDLGPASGASNVAAVASGLSPVAYFVEHQLPLALIVIPTVGALHWVWQKRCDAADSLAERKEEATLEAQGEERPLAPAIYGLLPILPLALLLVFSPLLVSSIQVDVVTAMFFSLFVGIVCEAFRLGSVDKALKGIVHFFKGMGDIFASVVTLIIAAEVFASGVKATGMVDWLISLAQGAGIGGIGMAVALIVLIGMTALITGSGNAALFSFANMIPNIAQSLGVSAVYLILPSQLAAGLFRSVSPVAGVIIAVANVASASPFQIVKRTSVPMIGGVVAMVIGHWVIG